MVGIPTGSRYAFRRQPSYFLIKSNPFLLVFIFYPFCRKNLRLVDAAAVYYNRLAGKTVKQKFDDVDAAVGELNEKLPTKYAGSNSAGGSANSAVKLDSSAGGAIQPIYFNNGKPVTCTHTLGKSVPSNAVFTDTNTWRDVVNNLTSTDASKSLSAAQGKILNESKARIARTGWGTSLTIPNLPHGFVIFDNWEVYLIWTAGNAGSYAVDVTKVYGVNDDLSFTIDRNTGTVVVRLKSGTGAITYIGS